MLSVIAERIALHRSERTSHSIPTLTEKMYLLSMLHELQVSGELLFAWENEYVLVNVAKGVVQGAYVRGNDGLAFGKILSNVTHIPIEEIEEVYHSVRHPEAMDGRRIPTITTGSFGSSSLRSESPQDDENVKPPEQRIGSVLVSAHMISPHMIGVVLRVQALERLVRVLVDVEACQYTFEPREVKKEAVNEEIYPYLDPKLGLDEVIFHAGMIRLPMKRVMELASELAKLQMAVHVPENFVLPDHLAISGGMTPEEAGTFVEWITHLSRHPEAQRAEGSRRDVFKPLFSSQSDVRRIRFAVAFVLTFPALCHKPRPPGLGL